MLKIEALCNRNFFEKNQWIHSLEMRKNHFFRLILSYAIASIEMIVLCGVKMI